MAERSRHDRDPKPLGDLLKTLVAGRGWQERMLLGRLRADWPAIVGARVAEHCEPQRLLNGVLTIRAEGGAWGTELTLLAPALAQGVNRVLGSDAVREVKVVRGSGGGSRRDP